MKQIPFYIMNIKIQEKKKKIQHTNATCFIEIYTSEELIMLHFSTIQV